MNYRVNKFYARTSHTSDKTVVIDLNMSDIISSLVIQYSVTQSSSVHAGTQMAGITKIEIVDGSNVLWSLTGMCNEALDWYSRGGSFNQNWNALLNGNTADRTMSINFGRYLWDPDYAFDPKRFTNPQLRVTLDIDAGGCSPATVYLTCFANLFDDLAVSPKGFLMAKEIKQWTMASATHEYTDLPTDYPYRNIYLQCLLAGTEAIQCVSNVKISEDNDKRIPYDLNQRELARVARGMRGQVIEHFYAVVQTTATYIYCAAADAVAAVGSQWAAAGDQIDLAFYDGDGGKLSAIAATATGNYQVIVRGDTPHAVFQLPCGIQDTPETWYNTRGINSLRADITGGAAAQGRLFVEQLMEY